MLNRADLAHLIAWQEGAVDSSFSPGRGDGDGVAHGFKEKGVTNHILIEGNGLPLALTSTPANGKERQQVAILLGRVKVNHGYGRPRSCPKEIHADKGYNSRALRVFLRTKGIRPIIAKRNTPHRKKRGRPSPKSSFRWKVERGHAWLQRKFLGRISLPGSHVLLGA